MPEQSTPPPELRPVTPLGVAAELLVRLEGRLADVPGVSDADRDDLRRARELTGGVDAYSARCTTPASPALTALAERTGTEDWSARSDRAGLLLESEMMTGHVEGQFLRFLVQLSRASRVLEIGMFTGYSALAMAEALPPGGRVVACEVDASTAELARECFDASSAGDLIRIEVGPARQTIDRLRAAGDQFDLVFVDADKPGYVGYVDALLQGGLLAPGGVICVDNTLLQGEPWLGGNVSAAGIAIAAFNDRVAADPRVEQVLVPLRDGVTLIRTVS